MKRFDFLEDGRERKLVPDIELANLLTEVLEILKSFFELFSLEIGKYELLKIFWVGWVSFINCGVKYWICSSPDSDWLWEFVGFDCNIVFIKFMLWIYILLKIKIFYSKNKFFKKIKLIYYIFFGAFKPNNLKPKFKIIWIFFTINNFWEVNFKLFKFKIILFW